MAVAVQPPRPRAKSQQASGNTGIASLRTAADLYGRVQQLQRGRGVLERQWKLNHAWFRGRQYTYYNGGAGRLLQLPTTDTLPHGRVRLTSNQIIRCSYRLLAKMTKTKPMFSATPGTADDIAVKGAQAAQSLAEYWWDFLNMSAKMREALLWSYIAAGGYWHISWDDQAGTPMKYLVNPLTGDPITDPDLESLFRAQITQMQADVTQFEKTVYLGDVRVAVLSPFQVFVDPTQTHLDTAKWAFVASDLDPDDVYGRWGVKVEADGTPSDFELGGPASTDKAMKTTKRVYCGYIVPQPAIPRGRHVYFTEQEILSDDPWLLPHRGLPLVKFGGLSVPGRPYDSSFVEQVLDLQKDYNRTLSAIIEYKNKTVFPRLWVPRGSFDITSLTDEPGEVRTYNPMGPNGDQIPRLEPIVPLPPYVFEHLANIKQSIEEVFSLAQINEGTPPPNVEAGIALDLLQEISTDSVAPLILANEYSLSQALMLLLSLAQKYYIEPRLISIIGASGAVRARTFRMADVDSGVQIHVDSGSSLPRTRAGRQSQILAWVQMGLLPADRAWRYMDIGDLKSLAMEYQADYDQADAEHDKLLSGEPLNVIAQQDALKAVQQPSQDGGGPVNPETGQPFQSQDEIQQYVHNAGLQPLAFENYQTMLDRHALWMKQPAFASFPEQVQRDAQMHWSLTLQRFMSLPRLPKDPAAVKTTVALRGTLDPETAAQALHHSGVIEADAQNLAQPPLDTQVRADLSKPQATASGNDPVDQNDQHLAAMAQAEQGMVHADAEQIRAQELHDQRLIHQQELHALRIAQQNKPTNK